MQPFSNHQSIRNPQSAMLPMEVTVSMIEPVLANRTEDVELECVLERLGLMFHPRRDVQHFALAHRDFLARDDELQRALQNVGHLLALMRSEEHTSELQSHSFISY